VTCNDVGAFADQNWIGKAESTNAAGDFRDLGRAVGPRVARIRNQSIERPVFELQAGPNHFGMCCILLIHSLVFLVSASSKGYPPLPISRHFFVRTAVELTQLFASISRRLFLGCRLKNNSGNFA